MPTECGPSIAARPNRQRAARPAARIGVFVLFLYTSLAWADGPRGSVYVPLDSWVYPAFDRLAALGAINRQFVGLRPWTRLQCAQLVMNAEDFLFESDGKNLEANTLYQSLKQEFSPDLDELSNAGIRQAGVESVYTRAMGITGTPLRDGYDFGQTISNDFGRPFNNGFNNVSGFSTQAVWGRFFAYARGEYQLSPAYAGLTGAQQAYIDQSDGTPSNPYLQARGTISQFDLLDTYIGVRLGVFNIAFGKQSLWWGPGTMGGMMMSDNADPMPMLRVDQVQPALLPWILQRLGPFRVQAFMGRLSGYQVPHAPYFHGEKIIFKPTPNLEIGFSRTAEAFGQGIPFTLRNLFATYFSITDVYGNVNPQNFPGKRQGGLDTSYRLPHLRNWVTLYTDTMTEDDPSPVVNPSRDMFNPGIYLSQLPGIRKVDFRFELANTHHHEEAYTSFFYKTAYTNKGFLMGNAVGRRGSAFDVSSTYWFSPRRRVEVSWYEHSVARSLVPSGGSQNAARIQADWLLHPQMELSVFVQHEFWKFPFLAAGVQNDNVVSVQLTIYPKKLRTRTALQDSY